jgi:hypothetical protein
MNAVIEDALDTYPIVSPRHYFDVRRITTISAPRTFRLTGNDFIPLLSFPFVSVRGSA